jgi:hypothetical protein
MSTSSTARPAVAWLCAFLAIQTSVAPAWGQDANPGIKIAVKEGDGALNNIRQLKAKDPVVVITDPAGKPIKGAAVSFILPELGASGVFTGGPQQLVTTDENGVAVGRGLKPNNVVGQFKIRVVASYQGATARTEITQTNAAPGKGGSNSKTIWIIALLAGGGAAAAAVAFTHGGGSTPANNGAVITPGSSTFNPPH